MTRIRSKMTPGKFVAWCDRHDVSYLNCDERIGIGRRTYFRYCAGTQAIPYTLVKLCGEMDWRLEHESDNTVTLRDLEKIIHRG